MPWASASGSKPRAYSNLRCLPSVVARELGLEVELALAGAERRKVECAGEPTSPNPARGRYSLGIRLAEVNRREEALAAELEAVDLFQALAQVQPDAFSPDLARSLSNLGDRLEEAGPFAEAIDAGEESIRRLVPFFGRSPVAFGSSMARIIRGYRRRTNAAGLEPNGALLEQMDQALADLERTSAHPVDPSALHSS